ncbi:hypothetical protein ATPR_0025 [Acetobacter tropicalis NBRC 101654]|uniref:Uncharacterized protein n=1 Tax=Acetobacter tropicalis NBRC 101654 TaxID=749388 RepID=F7V9H6_9PROT|nr:hypothetical protein ATPR_0025 [Acetobacter tropicalis NBRC 101654]
MSGSVRHLWRNKSPPVFAHLMATRIEKSVLAIFAVAAERDVNF